MARYYLKHYGIISSEDLDDSYLAHHGIKGMSWGKKNGPPYPLSEKKHNQVISKSKTLEEERNKHKPYTPREKKILRDRVLYNPFDKLYWNEKKIQKRQKQYIKERNKNAEFDDKTKLYKKRKETSIDDDLAIVNMKKDSKGSGAHNNCVLCSVAYELRRRGFDVLANDAIAGYTDEEIQKMFKGMKQLRTNRLKKTKNKDTKLEEVAAREVNSYIKDVMKTYKTMPNKSRGMMIVRWAYEQDPRYTVGGHAMAWEVIDNKFTVLDGQTGIKWPDGEQLSKLLSHTNCTDIYRLDNLEPDYEYIQKMGLVKKNLIGGPINVK